MNKLLKDNEKYIKQLCKKYKVKSLFVFGSLTSENFSENSDVDFLVSFHAMEPEDYADNYYDLADDFEDLLKRPVDLVTEKSLRNPYFINSINKTKYKIYEA